ncbi:hypothetical protein JHK85_000831 [Glycine max]|nr:hypothetical protein JHK85_000831 [Glycine max]
MKKYMHLLQALNAPTTTSFKHHLPKKDFVALKSRETSSIREEKKSSSKALKVQMANSDGLDNSSGDSTDDEVALMFRKFK